MILCFHTVGCIMEKHPICKSSAAAMNGRPRRSKMCWVNVVVHWNKNTKQYVNMTHPIHTCNKQVTPRAEYFPSPTTTSGSILPFRGQIWVPIKYKVVILCGNHRTKKLDPLRHLDAILWLSVLMYQAFWNKGYHRRWLLTLHYTQIHTVTHLQHTR